MSDYSAREMVRDEVYACISDMADCLFGDEDGKYASYDEWDNIYEPYCPDCGNYISSEEEYVICPCCNKEYERSELDFKPKEIYEYWLVDPFLGEQLRKHGEAIFERYGAWIWGRETTGQAIYLDGVIRAIYKERQMSLNEI